MVTPPILPYCQKGPIIMPRKKKPTIAGMTLTDIRSKYCTNPELSDQFVSDLLTITGLEIDDEGYLVDPEDDPFEPEYVSIKNKPCRYAKNGVLHSRDLLFDPYNNTSIMEELFRQYLAKSHPEVVQSQILAAKKGVVPHPDSFGFITIIYSNGDLIKTANHWKDTTKYLDAFMRLESMTDNLVLEKLYPYDAYEAEFFKKYPNGVAEYFK